MSKGAIFVKVTRNIITYLIVPLDDLEPNTDYYVSVLNSDLHPEPGMDSGQGFRTGTDVLTMEADPPGTVFLGYMDRGRLLCKSVTGKMR